ncbi:MAG TPA: nuclear transport factor 2 family protein [Ilumatobacteraceae bacterium]
MDDIEQIKQLKARYFRCLDTKDWAGLQAVFIADAEVDMTGEGGGVTHSAADFVAGLSAMLADVITVHHGHMPEIALLSDLRATGIWAMEDELWWPEGSALKHLHGYGHYTESYIKLDGMWAIASMRLTRLRRDLDFA